MALSAQPPELRCTCGALIARATASGIEFYCRRCKRAVMIPFKELAGREHLVRFFPRGDGGTLGPQPTPGETPTPRRNSDRLMGSQAFWPFPPFGPPPPSFSQLT